MRFCLRRTAAAALLLLLLTGVAACSAPARDAASEPADAPPGPAAPAPAPAPPAEEEMELQVYFHPAGADDCAAVAPVTRRVPKTEAAAAAALAELLRGPTAQELAEGYTAHFSAATHAALSSLHVSDGTAYVNLQDIRSEIANASTSCGSAAFFAQVEATLMQFGTVERVYFAIEGQPGIFYEWMQISSCDPAYESPLPPFCDPTPYGG